VEWLPKSGSPLKRNRSSFNILRTYNETSYMK
jgi:hypothetical protein